MSISYGSLQPKLKKFLQFTTQKRKIASHNAHTHLEILMNQTRPFKTLLFIFSNRCLRYLALRWARKQTSACHASEKKTFFRPLSLTIWRFVLHPQSNVFEKKFGIKNMFRAKTNAFSQYLVHFRLKYWFGSQKSEFEKSVNSIVSWLT